MTANFGVEFACDSCKRTEFILISKSELNAYAKNLNFDGLMTKQTEILQNHRWNIADLKINNIPKPTWILCPTCSEEVDKFIETMKDERRHEK